MDLFEMLMGSGKNREDYQDFVNRYDDGPPWEGYSDEEVLDRYGSVAHKVSPADYEQAARDAFARLSPEERAEFSRYLEERARRRSLNIPGRAPDPASGMGDLGWLSNVTSQIHQQPGLLRDLLSGLTGQSTGSSGTIFSSPLAKAALAGIAATLLKRILSPR